MPSEWLLYLRKSVGYAGLARQRDTTTPYLEGIGGKVTAEYSDADRTAYRDVMAPLPPRPNFDRMLAELPRRPDAGIGAWHADRLGRDPEAAEILIRACIPDRHLIATRTSGIYEVWTATGRKRLRADILDAAQEVDHNTERLVAAKAEAAAEGRYLGGLRPFGWRLDRNARNEDGELAPGVLVLDEAEAALIVQGSADILAGVAVREIARRWNAAGLTGAGGGRWTTSTVHKVLSRPRNAGLAEHHGKVVDLGLDDQGKPRKARWPEIVDEPTWRAVAAILSDPARKTNHGGTAVSRLLSGIALCGGCGLAVIVNASADGTPRYRCSRHARGLPPSPGPHASRKAADIDAYITVTVAERLRRPDASMLLRADHADDRKELRAREAAIAGRQAEQWQLYRTGVITDAELTEGRRELAADLAGIRSRLDALDEADVLAPMLADPEAAWDRATLGQQRAVVAGLVYVTLMPGAKFSRPPGWKPGDGQFDPRLIDIRWAHPLPSDG